MNNREAFEAAVKECGNEEKFAKNMQLSLACYAYFIHGVNAALASQAQQPTNLSEQLREYAGNSGYSHNDYADTMIAAASEIERLTASQAQQTESQWISVEDQLPAYGQIVDLSIDGVLQNETYEIDATDNDLYLTNFWTRDGLEDGLDIEQGQFWRARLPMSKPLPPAPEGVDQ